MHSLLNSIRKRIYTARLSSARCKQEWSAGYWSEDQGTRAISCRTCRKFSATRLECSVPFGSPIRKCVTAAQEANLHSLSGKNVLEIGFGKHSIPRRLVASAGGTWTGIDPYGDRTAGAEFGKACFGAVEDIPFADASFDVVVGIQTLEHWSDPLPDGHLPPGYERSLDEVHRILKPGGAIYFDAPIHLHGHEMFIAGDIDRIRGHFSATLWDQVRIEKWRQEYAPLERYPTPQGDQDSWQYFVKTYSPDLLNDIRTNQSVWLLTVSALKKSNHAQ
jgi:SAM-dependent methyltransferase